MIQGITEVNFIDLLAFELGQVEAPKQESRKTMQEWQGLWVYGLKTSLSTWEGGLNYYPTQFWTGNIYLRLYLYEIKKSTLAITVDKTTIWDDTEDNHTWQHCHTNNDKQTPFDGRQEISGKADMPSIQKKNEWASNTAAPKSKTNNNQPKVLSRSKWGEVDKISELSYQWLSPTFLKGIIRFRCLILSPIFKKNWLA